MEGGKEEVGGMECIVGLPCVRLYASVQGNEGKRGDAYV